jgi:hypothetical protein
VDDRARDVVLDHAGGSIVHRFHARDAHLVLSRGARGPIPFRVLLDGEAPGPSHGVDVDIDENGELRDGRMYQLVRQHDPVRDRTLQSTFLEPGERRGVRVHVRAASDADCCDRPRAIWEGVVAERMTTLPLEVDGLLAELEDPASAPVRWSGGGTTMGHVHFKVAAIPETIAFYRDLLGFGVMARFGQRAAFLGAGGYHHHVGANTWESANAPPRPPGTAALRRATLVLPDAGERAHPRAARAARPAGGRARR